jgi:hypothetical protein
MLTFETHIDKLPADLQQQLQEAAQNPLPENVEHISAPEPEATPVAETPVATPAAEVTQATSTETVDDLFGEVPKATPPQTQTPTGGEQKPTNTPAETSKGYEPLLQELGVTSVDELKSSLVKAKERTNDLTISPLAMEFAKMFDAYGGDMQKINGVFSRLQSVDYTKEDPETIFRTYIARTNSNLDENDIEELYTEEFAELSGVKQKLRLQEVVQKLEAMDEKERTQLKSTLAPALEKLEQQDKVFKAGQEVYQRLQQETFKFISTTDKIKGVELQENGKKLLANVLKQGFQDDSYLTRIFWDPETKQFDTENMIDAYLRYSPAISKAAREKYVALQEARVREEAKKQAYVESMNIGTPSVGKTSPAGNSNPSTPPKTLEEAKKIGIQQISI